MNIDVLGPLRAASGDGPLDITGQSATALAWLAMHVDRPVGLAELARVVPGSGQDATQRMRSLLRRLAADLPDGALVRGPSTARLALSEEAIDAGRFATLAIGARRALREGHHGQVAADVETALGLWRADPYPELRQQVSAAPEVERLRRVRVGLLEMQQEVAMHSGVDFTTVADLRDLMAAHPERLGFRLLLARALHLMDRQADALEMLRRTATDFGGHPASRRLTDLIAHRDPRVSSISVLADTDDPSR